MANDFQDFGTWFQEQASRTLADQLRAAQRYTELVQRLGRGELFTQAVRDKYLRFVRDDAMGYACNLATLSLSYYHALDALGRAYNDRFFDQVLGGAPVPGTQTAAPEPVAHAAAAPRQVELALHAAIGEEATRSFVLENKRSTPAEISFLVSDFVGPAGATPFRPALEFEPSRFSMMPGEERTITLRLKLLAKLFAPGSRYTATVLVRGYDDLELALHIWADAPLAPEADAGAAAAPDTTKGEVKKRKAE